MVKNIQSSHAFSCNTHILRRGAFKTAYQVKSNFKNAHLKYVTTNIITAGAYSQAPAGQT